MDSNQHAAPTTFFLVVLCPSSFFWRQYVTLSIQPLFYLINNVLEFCICIVTFWRHYYATYLAKFYER